MSDDVDPMGNNIIHTSASPIAKSISSSSESSEELELILEMSSVRSLCSSSSSSSLIFGVAGCFDQPASVFCT